MKAILKKSTAIFAILLLSIVLFGCGDGKAAAESPQQKAQAQLHEACVKILAEITDENMSTEEKARAVYDYVRMNISYVGDCDRSCWQAAALEGLLLKRGDCYTYYASVRALLTELGIENMEVKRKDENSQHFWNLINCGDGWYHLDATPRSGQLPYFDSFMFTDREAEFYTVAVERKNGILNFYSYEESLYPPRAEKSKSSKGE